MPINWKGVGSTISKTFNRRPKSRDRPKPASKGAGTVTKAQRDRLCAQRDKPVTRTQPAPEGAARRETDKVIARQREERIKAIDERLGAVKGRAREDFERER